MSQKKLFDTHLCNSEHLKTFPGVILGPTQNFCPICSDIYWTQTDKQTDRHLDKQSIIYILLGFLHDGLILRQLRSVPNSHQSKE